MLHYKPADGYFGDPIPFFWNGEYHMFYLKAPLEPQRHGADFTSYAHLSSRDLLHWREHPIAISPTPGGPDALSCWTGSIIEKDGTFYLFYTGHGRDVYEWPQTICLATSTDLDHWTKWPANPLLTPDPQQYRISDWRDPFVFWYAAESCYLMSITSMRAGDSFWKGGCLVFARSTDLLHWDVQAPYYHPGNHGYPECSDLFQLGRHWYLVASICHETRYRIADQPQGPWRVARTDSFDSVFNYAAKTICDGDRRFIVGWIRTKLGLNDDGPWEWAGHMAFPREMVPAEDGTLYARLPEEFDAIRGACLADLLQPDQRSVLFGHCTGGAGTLNVLGRPLFAQVACQGAWPAFDLEVEFTLDTAQGCAGVIFGADGDQHPGYELAVDSRHQLLYFRKHTDRHHHYYFETIDLRPGEPIRLRLIVEDTIFEAFVNDRVALSGRFYHQAATPQLSFFAEETNAVVQIFRVHELLDVNAEELLTTAGSATDDSGNGAAHA
jgi:beta-fructofuranosidase